MTLKIYTKTGDQGQTGLLGGARVAKSDLRIDLLGELDELNAIIGQCRCQMLPISCLLVQANLLESLQKHLFTLGTLVASPDINSEQFAQRGSASSLLAQMEEQIDQMTDTMPPLQNFILPGGSQLASSVHWARTVARRVERKMVNFGEYHLELGVEVAISFLNRLSDYFFTLARYGNWLLGQEDTIWP